MNGSDVTTREDRVALVERFLRCMVRDEIDRLPIGPGFSVESPLVPRLSGRAAMDYVRAVAASTRRIEILEHIVEGDRVATLSENETDGGRLPVFARFEIEGGRIRDVRVFYDSRRIAGGPSPGA